jgi:cytoskeleton protein RodZ
MTEQRFDARSPGEILRTAREKQGLHIAALAAAIKVAPRKLDALEHDRWDELPDATFVRALAQTVCRTLKIDAAPVLELLPRAGALPLEPGKGGLNAPFRERPGRDEPGLSLGGVRPMVIAASLLMVAAVAVYFVPEPFWAGRFGNPFASGGASAPAVLATAPAASDPVLPPPLPAQDAASAPVLAQAPTPSALPTPLPADAASSPAGLPLPMPATAAPATTPAVPASSLLELRTTAASWIEVREIGGRLLLSRVVEPGESVGLDGQLPIRLTIGNAAVTRLAFRGQPYDLATGTRDNVARVELK